MATSKTIKRVRYICRDYLRRKFGGCRAWEGSHHQALALALWAAFLVAEHTPLFTDWIASNDVFFAIYYTSHKASVLCVSFILYPVIKSHYLGIIALSIALSSLIDCVQGLTRIAFAVHGFQFSIDQYVNWYEVFIYGFCTAAAIFVSPQDKPRNKMGF